MKPVDRILVIDDDVELCTLVSEYLEPEGFQVESAPDGNRGLEQALSGEHLLVVLDVMLPGLNGFEVLRRLRDKSRIPVLLLTARGEDVDPADYFFRTMIRFETGDVELTWLNKTLAVATAVQKARRVEIRAWRLI